MRLLSAVVCLFLLLPAATARAEGIAWDEGSFDDALARAAASGSRLIVDVYATWCGPCQALDREVFPNAVVGEAARGLVAVKVDAEAGDGPAVVERYHVVGYPTVLVLRPDGTEIDRIFGYVEPDAFAATLTDFLDGRGTIDVLREQVAAASGDLDLALDLGVRAIVRGDYETGDPALRAVIAADADNARGLRSRAHLVIGKYRYLRGARDYPAALAEFAILIDELPEADEADEAVVQSGIAHARAGNAEEARRFFDAFVAADPTDAGRYNAVAFSMYREGFDLPRGIELATAGLAIAPDDASLWDTLAELQFASGDAEAARASIARAVELSPEEAYFARQLFRFGGGAAQP